MQALLEWFGAKPTLESFTDRLLGAMARQEAMAWHVDKAEGMLVKDGHKVSLQNMFLEYRNSTRKKRPALLGKYLEVTRSLDQKIPELWVAAAKNIVPIVRSNFVACTVEIGTRGNSKPMEPFAAAPFVGDLQVCLMYDFGPSVMYVKQTLLEAWGQSFEDVRERALSNFAKLEPATWVMHDEGFAQLASPESYAESMLLLDRVVNALPFAEHAVFLPCNRGVLFAADARSDEIVSAMLREAIRCANGEPWPMSATLCTRSDGRWTEWKPSDATRVLAHDLFLIHQATNYGAQHDALEEWQKKNAIDRFVATFILHQRPDSLVSYATWAEDVRTLLPVADLVGLVRSSEESGEKTMKFVAWEDLVTVCAHRMRLTEESPTRYEVDSFPDEGEWGRMEDLR